MLDSGEVPIDLACCPRVRAAIQTCASISLLASALAPGPLLAQGRVIQGIVVDSTGTPIAYVNVTAVGSGRRTVAGADGTFRLSMDSSAKRAIELRRIGYHPLTYDIDPWPDSSLRLVMAVATRTLDVVTVAVRRSQGLALQGFYDRMSDVERGINHGFFITPEDMASRPGARVTDLLRGFPAVRVTLVKTGHSFSVRGRKGWQPQGVDGCRLEIYIDGARFYSIGEGRGLDDAHIFIDDLITASSIAGIEVYPRSVTAPPKYQSLNGRCGVMLIWTK